MDFCFFPAKPGSACPGDRQRGFCSILKMKNFVQRAERSYKFADSIDMNKRINFEDNIFMLNARLRLVQDQLQLDADPVLFLQKTLDDVIFIDYVLGILLEQLCQNEWLLERDEQLENLSDLEWKFSQALSGIRGELENRENPDTFGFSGKLDILEEHSHLRRDSISEVSLKGNSGNTEPLVTSDELSQLLKDF
jgi:hypothetical protein